MRRRPPRFVVTMAVTMLVAGLLSPASATAADGAEIGWSFESGGLDGWRVSSGSFGRVVSDKAVFNNTPKIPYNKHGRYYLTTLDNPDGTFNNAYRGTVISPRFTLRRPTVSMLVGGGATPNVYVAVCRPDASKPDGCAEIARAQGFPQTYERTISREAMAYRVLDLSGHLGQEVFLRVVDAGEGDWEYVAVDNVRANLPAMPTGVRASRERGAAVLSWQAVAERDIAGYHVYRSTQRDTGYVRLTRQPVSSPSFRDPAAPGQGYYYRVAAVERDGTESEPNLTYAQPWKDLHARGATQTYRGDTLSAIDFPVGPMGASGIVHDGSGRRPQWWIFNNNQYRPGTGVLPNSFFAVAAGSGGKQVVRALQTTPEGPFAAMSSLRFQGEYPLARYDFDDSALPVRVTQEVHNPFIPGNLKDSGIPTAIYRFTLTNPGREPVAVSLLAAQQNAVGFNGYDTIGGPNLRQVNGYGANRNTVQDKRVQLAGDGGGMVLSAPVGGEARVTATASWNTLESLRADLADDGALSGPQHAAGDPAQRTTVDAALATSLTLRPGQSVTVPVVLSWHFPRADHGWGGTGVQYANWWPDADAVDRYVVGDLERLSSLTRRYHDALYASNLPQYLLDRLSGTTAVLHSPSVFWNAKGFFGAWEGYGCCVGMPTHVWHYAQAPARLYPDVGRMWTSQWLDNQAPDGHIPVRYATDDSAYLDGQAGVILQAYRTHLQGSDRTWLDQYWPKVRKATEFLITAYDKDGDGLLTGPQWTTLDSAESGTGSWLGSLHLAALNAASVMAELESDTATAKRYRSWYDQGRKAQERHLWNGEYFRERAENLPGTVRYEDGVAIDMLLGQWWSTQLGLGDIYDPAKMNNSLRALVRHNFQENFVGDNPQFPYRYAHFWRNYVQETDSGTQMFTWPKGDRPPNASFYFDEPWTGTEYTAAATLFQRGLVDEGLKVARAAADRYDGKARKDPFLYLDPCGVGTGTGNPFSDDECGRWYGRSLSSWSMLLALQGFSHDGPARTLGFEPTWQPENHRSFFTAGDAWGLFSQTRSGGTQVDQVEVRYGTVEVRQLRLALPDRAVAKSAVVMVDNHPLPGTKVRVDGSRTLVELPAPVVIREGQTLRVVLTG